MHHPICRVTSCEVVGPFVLRVGFHDKSEQTIDFRSILTGELYGPLSGVQLFNQVRIDPEVQTLVWPNGADFDPATLHDWPQHAAEVIPLWDLHRELQGIIYIAHFGRFKERNSSHEPRLRHRQEYIAIGEGVLRHAVGLCECDLTRQSVCCARHLSHNDLVSNCNRSRSRNNQHGSPSHRGR